jgi:hypothetical protein
MKTFWTITLCVLPALCAEAQNPFADAPNPQKTLHVYDWKALAPPVPGGEIVSEDGVSVLKIENTNDTPLRISLLKISDARLVREAYFVRCEVKYDVPIAKVITLITNPDNPHIISPYPHWGGGVLSLRCYLPPAAPGGDERISNGREYGLYGGTLEGNSNWRPCQLTVDRNAFEGLPIQLEVYLNLAGRGTVYFRPVKLLGVVGSWWSEQQSGMVGGVGGVFGGIIGCFGGLLGYLASMGKARKFVLTTTKIFIALGILLTITGIIAIAFRQPYFVWCVFLLPGVILTLVFSLNLPTIQRRYDDLEIRRMASIDAMGS